MSSIANEDDSAILRAAIGGGADYLVTFDRHLLALDPYEGIRIVRAGELMNIIQNQHGA